MTDPKPDPKPTVKCDGCKRKFDEREMMPPNRNRHVFCEECFHNDHAAGLDAFAMQHPDFMA